MAVFRRRAGKRYRDLNFQNFKFRAKRMGILFPEQAVMAALHEVSERLQRKGKDYRLYSGSTAGRMLNLSHIERVEAEAWTLAAVDVSGTEAKALAHERKVAAQRARRKATRAVQGCKPRDQYEAESAEKKKPWQAVGMSRRTWYRRGKPTQHGKPAEINGARASGKGTPTKLQQVA